MTGQGKGRSSLCKAARASACCAGAEQRGGKGMLHCWPQQGERYHVSTELWVLVWRGQACGCRRGMGQ